MKDFMIITEQNTTLTVKAWDKSSAYEFAQDIYGLPIKQIVEVNTELARN